MNRAHWITWYDLPDDARDAYLSWVHETYIPGILARPGFLWAAHYATVPKGTMRTMRREAELSDFSAPFRVPLKGVLKRMLPWPTAVFGSSAVPEPYSTNRRNR